MSFHSSKTVPIVRFLPAVVVALALASCQKSKAPNPTALTLMQQVPVRAVAAISSDVPLEVSAVGNVEAMASVDVKSRIAGQILRADFQEGQDVAAGQLLFEIDAEPVQRQIAELRADVAKDDAQQRQALANIAKDEAQLKQSRAAADRGVSLTKDGIFSKEQTEQLVATADSGQAALDADRAAAESAAEANKADRARLAQMMLQLSYCRVTAPISGRAGAVAVKPGNLVKDNDAVLVTILQVAPVYVSFGVPEQILPQVRMYNHQSPLEVDAVGGDEKAERGKLQFIDSSVDATTGTIKLKAVFPNSNRTFWPGQFVKVTARLIVEHDRILIPSRTLETGQQGKYVWVMSADSSVAMRPVEVLRLYEVPGSAEQAVVRNGLKAGEMVISEGQMRLMPGAKVRLLKAESQLGEARSPAMPGKT